MSVNKNTHLVTLGSCLFLWQNTKKNWQLICATYKSLHWDDQVRCSTSFMCIFVCYCLFFRQELYLDNKCADLTSPGRHPAQGHQDHRGRAAAAQTLVNASENSLIRVILRWSEQVYLTIRFSPSGQRQKEIKAGVFRPSTTISSSTASSGTTQSVIYETRSQRIFPSALIFT